MKHRTVWMAAAVFTVSAAAYLLLHLPAGHGGIPDEGRRVVLPVLVTPPAEVEDLNTNTFTAFLEDKLGLTFKFVIAGAANKKERKQLLFASGDYPPVLLSGELSPDEQISYGMQGTLIPLNDLIDRYGPQIRRVLAAKPELRQAITAPDGNIYALPSINECLHCWYAQKLWINKEWLEKLHLEPPQTTEQLYRVLRAFKTGDPNGNGIADEIPLTGATDSWHTKPAGFLMSAFIYGADDNYFYMDNGRVGLAAAQPAWREGLAYMRKLYAEGLIDPAAFTQTLDGLIELANNPGANVIGSAAMGHIRMAFTGREEARNLAYVTVPPLTGPEGYQAAGYFNLVENGQFAITDKATEEQAAAAIRLADYLYTEEAAILNEFGPEGLWWRRGGTGDVDMHGKPAAYKLMPGYWDERTRNDSWNQMGILYRDRQLRESWAIPEDPNTKEGYEYRLYKETMANYFGKEPPEVYPSYVFVDPEDASEASRLRVLINDYVESNLVQFITGAKSPDTDWQAYLNGFEDLKLDRYLSIYQQAYDRYKRNG